MLAIAPLPANARQTAHTVYSYYPVSGQSLQEIHQNMVLNGPSSNGVKGFGVTSVVPGNQMSVSSCVKSGNYHFDLKFIIRLPKIGNAVNLSGIELAQVAKFVKFVQKHEETHRSIWMNYAARYERLLQGSGSKDCASSHAKAMALWKQMMDASRPDQISFDQAQRSVLNSQQFIRLAAR